MHDVVVSGMGAVTACGIGVEPLWQAAREGRSGVGPTTLTRWLGHKVRISAQVDRDAVSSRLTPQQIETTDPCSRFALVAAAEALAQSGLAPKDVAGRETAVVIGCSIGGISTLDDGYHAFYAEEASRVSPYTVPRIMANAPASQIGMAHGITGPTLAIATACASGSQAIGLGMWLVRSGQVRRAIVGGTDANIAPGMLRAWEMTRALAPDACRPFSQGRNGMVLGEGAGMLVIERGEDARARGVRPAARLAGYGTSGDAGDLLRPDPAGAAAALTAALDDAGLPPEAIGYIAAHGTGTVFNDIAETAAVRTVFGGHADGIAMSSTKPVTGHTLGAAGALNLLIAIRSLEEQFAPPTLNWLGADPQCDLDVVPNRGRAHAIQAVMANAFAFGGINAALVAARAT